MLVMTLRGWSRSKSRELPKGLQDRRTEGAAFRPALPGEQQHAGSGQRRQGKESADIAAAFGNVAPVDSGRHGNLVKEQKEREAVYGLVGAVARDAITG